MLAMTARTRASADALRARCSSLAARLAACCVLYFVSTLSVSLAAYVTGWTLSLRGCRAEATARVHASADAPANVPRTRCSPLALRSTCACYMTGGGRAALQADSQWADRMRVMCWHAHALLGRFRPGMGDLVVKLFRPRLLPSISPQTPSTPLGLVVCNPVLLHVLHVLVWCPLALLPSPAHPEVSSLDG